MKPDTTPNRIRQARKAANMTQQELAEAIGVHQSSISDWEKGISTPSLRNFPKVAATLGLTLADLLGEDAA